MGKWLAALRAPEKQTENVRIQNPQNPQNPSKENFKSSKGGFEGFEGSPSGQLAIFFDRSTWDDFDWQIAYDERAAILEHDEGLPRHVAARLARQQIDDQRRQQWH